MVVVHPEPYSVEDFLGLPEDGMRHELYDGALHVTPPPGFLHGLIVARLRDAIARVAPPAAIAMDNLGVRLSTARLLVPDLVVVTPASVPAGARYVGASDVLLVAEVESPSSVRMDRVMKSVLYAEAGVPLYLRIVPEGPDGPEAHFGRLSEGAYRLESAHAGQVLRLGDPLPLSLDPADLVHR